MKPKVLLMIGMSSYSDWERGVQNRNYHVLQKLRTNPKISWIIYVDFLPFTLRLSAKRFIRDIFAFRHSFNYKDIFSISRRIDEKLHIFSTVASMISMKYVIRGIKNSLAKFGEHELILWSYNPMFVKEFDRLNPNSYIFDTVDNWIEHGAYRSYTKRLVENYSHIASKADHIFMVSPKLSELYLKFGRIKNCHYVSNGVDTDYFTDERLALTSSIEKLEEQRFGGKKILGYIGTIQSNRVNFEILDAVASYHKDKSLVLCGRVWRDSEVEFKKLIKKHSNIVYCGAVSRENWIEYCSYFDVTLNPHLVNDFTKYTSPTKIFEYLACGKPVVTTRVEGVSELSNYCFIAEDVKEFCQFIDIALKKDSQSQRQKRIEYTRQSCSWKERVDSMVTRIFN